MAFTLKDRARLSSAPPALQFPAVAHDTKFTAQPPVPARAASPGTCSALPQVPCAGAVPIRAAPGLAAAATLTRRTRNGRYRTQRRQDHELPHHRRLPHDLTAPHAPRSPAALTRRPAGSSR